MGFFESKKRLLVLFCSPNGHGHTRMLLDSFLEGVKGKKERGLRQKGRMQIFRFGRL